MSAFDFGKNFYLQDINVPESHHFLDFQNEIKKRIDLFAQECAKVKDTCILNAMAEGIDLHEMGIQDGFEFIDNKIIYKCKAFKL